MSQQNGRKINRREFLGQGLAGAIGVGVALGSSGAGSPAWAAEENAAKRLRKGGMVYRRLGRTELMVSELGLGGSPSPPPPVFSAALDRGVNFVDSSAVYGRGQGERNIGRMIKGRRDKVIVCTKFHPYRFQTDVKAQSVKAVEDALERLQTDYIDIICVHGASAPEQCLNDDVLAAFAQLKQEGKVRFTGLSNHSDPAHVLPPIIESGHYDVILLALSVFSGTRVTRADVKAGKVYDNWLADSGLQAVLDLAQERDVGIVAMKTMAGGARQKLAKYQVGETTLPQAKLKWALSREAVACALSEMLNFDILDENLAVVGTTLSANEQTMLRQHILDRSADVCRMCGTCLRACPAGVPILDILRYITYHDEHGKIRHARQSYRRHVSAHTFAACADCDACRRACPHGLDIPAKLRYARSVLA